MENDIARVCYEKYAELGKNGKPKENEWTLLAGFVAKYPDDSLKLISLATGTKCIGKTKMSDVGAILNDSHAEILARRGFLRYLYLQMEVINSEKNSQIICANEDGKYSLKEGIEVHFFCSHVPCGDASIMPKLKRKAVNESCENKKKIKVDDTTSGTNLEEEEEHNFFCVDIHRTGGKCVGVNDPYGPGELYHTVGAVRTKPGRGEPTLSLSCSDKMAKWIYCGVQGALLSLLLKDTIHVKSITVGGGGPFSIKAMERALIDRSSTLHRPDIKQSSLIFQHSRYSLAPESNPSSTSIIWIDTEDKPVEVSVEGKRLGITKKSPVSASRLKISKMELFKKFIGITGDKYRGMTYGTVKSQAQLYYRQFDKFKKRMKCWSEKPNLLDFLPDT